MSLGSLILGFIGGFVLSDLIVSKYPQAGNFKIMPSSVPVSIPSQLQPTVVPGFKGFGWPPKTEEERRIEHYQKYGTTTLPPKGTGYTPAPKWIRRYIDQHGVPESFMKTESGRRMLRNWKIL